jgi:TPP-dependent pyruvate/acetoin dehydrogenase alpha subunit
MLIEAVTYRVGPHTTSDDPSRYRDPAETEEWKRRDPLERVRVFLSEREAWTPEWQRQIEQEAAEEIERAVTLAEGLAAPTSGDMFEGMFESMPAHLVRQQDEAVGVL